MHLHILYHYINPRRACTARATVLGLCVYVCLSVCLLVDISLLEHLFVLKTMSCIYSTGKEGQKICGDFF